MIGSANFTKGGLENNRELSFCVHNSMPDAIKEIDDFIAPLIRDGEMVEADEERLAIYRREHAIYNAHLKLAERKAHRINKLEPNPKDTLETLEAILEEMKRDDTRLGFEASKNRRRKNVTDAAKQLKRIRNESRLKECFLSLYEPLCKVDGYWHSGGLERGKTNIASKALEFQNALTNFDKFYKKQHASASVADIYKFLLDLLKPIKGAGTNVITEILHTYDNGRFSVMNKNSVSGMSLAGITGFPVQPSKLNLNPSVYENFCEEANKVRENLGLTNFSELDAVFNYAYWEEWDIKDNEEDK